MKKFAAIAAAALLVVAMSVPAFAAGSKQATKQDGKVVENSVGKSAETGSSTHTMAYALGAGAVAVVAAGVATSKKRS